MSLSMQAQIQGSSVGQHEESVYPVAFAYV